MPRDPYAVLEVAPDASDEAISWAYRRRLNEASRLGAWKEAQEIDAAYTALRDPIRRQMLDEHGLVAPSGRVPVSLPRVPPQALSSQGLSSRTWSTPPPLPPVTVPSVPRSAVPPPPPTPPMAAQARSVRHASAPAPRPAAAGRIDWRVTAVALVFGLVVGAGADHVLDRPAAPQQPTTPAAVVTGGSAAH